MWNFISKSQAIFQCFECYFGWKNWNNNLGNKLRLTSIVWHNFSFPIFYFHIQRFPFQIVTLRECVQCPEYDYVITRAICPLQLTNWKVERVLKKRAGERERRERYEGTEVVGAERDEIKTTQGADRGGEGEHYSIEIIRR